jgi:hypothetical protein
MKFINQSYFVLLLVIIATSCTTVRVAKVQPGDSASGVRYSLGKPFIKVTPDPKGDGTYTTELIYLPDENQTYAVDAKAFLTKYTMELNVDENGILKKVDWTKGGESTGGNLVGAAGELAKAEIERKQKEKEAAEAELKEKVKTSNEELKKLKETRNQKNLDLTAAQDNLKSLNETYPEGSRTAEIKEEI